MTTVSHWVHAGFLATAFAAAAAGRQQVLPWLAAGLLGCLAARTSLERRHLAAAHRLGSAVRARLRARLLDAVLVPERLHDPADRVGSRSLAVTEGVDGVDRYVAHYIPHALQVFVLPPLLCLLLAGIHPVLGLAGAAGYTVVVTGPRLWDRMLARRGAPASDFLWRMRLWATNPNQISASRNRIWLRLS